MLNGATHVFLKSGLWSDTNVGKNDSYVSSLAELGHVQSLCTAYDGFGLYVKKMDTAGSVMLASGCTITSFTEMHYWKDKPQRPYNCCFSNPNGPSCLAELQNAFKNASANGSTYALSADVTLLPDMQLTLQAGCVLNLDLAGHRLEVTRSDAIQVYGSLKVQNKSTQKMSAIPSLLRGRIVSAREGAIISCYDGSKLEVTGSLVGSFGEAVDVKGYVNPNIHFGTAIYAEGKSKVNFAATSQGRGNPWLAIAGDATVAFEGGGYSGNPSSPGGEGKCIYICSGNPTVSIQGGSFDCQGSLVQSDAGAKGSIAISGAKLQSWHTPFLLGGATQVDLRNCCYSDTSFAQSQTLSVSRLAALDNPLSSCVVHPGVYAYLGSFSVISPFVESGSDASMVSGSWNNVPINCSVSKSQMLSNLEAVNFPVFKIDTIGRKDPTFDIVNPPTGRDAVGQGIKNVTKEPARLEITLGNKVLYDSGLYEKSTSGLTIKVRGNTSASSALNPPPPYELAKKFPYKLKLQKKADLLFHDGGKQESSYKSKDWNLLASSRTINSPIGFYLNYLMGFDWTPGWRFVNLILNNKYRGLYILVESVEPADNRVSVADDGYLAELDAYWWNEDLYVKTPKCPKHIGYTFKYPDVEDITTEQVAYFKDTMTKVEDAIIEKGTYPELIETASWATWVLGHDILGSKDGAGVNQYIKKQDSSEGSRVAYALLWDFDDLRYDANNWSTVHNIDSAGYFPNLMKSANRTFNTAYWAKWAEMRGLIPSILTMLNEWRQDGTSTAYDQSRALETGNVFYNFDSQYQVFKDWFEARVKWIDKQFAAGKMPVDPEIWNALVALSENAVWRQRMASDAFVERFGSNFLRAALSPTGKRGLDGKPLYVWSEFLANTDPLDPGDIPGRKRPFVIILK